MNVSSAKRNIPKDIKSLKSKFFFISITSILCRIEVNHPVSRLPVVGATNNIISQYALEHRFEKCYEFSSLTLRIAVGDCIVKFQCIEQFEKLELTELFRARDDN